MHRHAPATAGQLQSGASGDEIKKLEQLIGVAFPEDAKASYEAHDGAENLGLFPHSDPTFLDRMAFSPLSLKQVAVDWKNWKALVDTGEFASQLSRPMAGVRNDWWNLGWVPIASNGGGDFQCIDLAPAEGGIDGQVIRMWHDSPRREVIAASLADYLEQIAKGLEEGTYTYEEDEGVILANP